MAASQQCLNVTTGSNFMQWEKVWERRPRQPAVVPAFIQITSSHDDDDDDDGVVSSQSHHKCAALSAPHAVVFFWPRTFCFSILPLGRRGCGSRWRCCHGYMVTLQKLARLPRLNYKPT